MNDFSKDPDLRWDLFTAGTIMPLFRLVSLWANEEQVSEAIILRRLAGILMRTDDYMMVCSSFTVPDPNVGKILENVAKQGNWKGAMADAYDKELLKSFHGGNKEVADTLSDGKIEVAIKELSVDCDALFDAMHKFGLPTPDFLRLIVGEQATAEGSKTSQSNANPVEPDQPFLTVNDFCRRYSAFKVGGVRNLLFHRDTNGLASSKAVVKVGNKVLINVEKFHEWVEMNGATA